MAGTVKVKPDTALKGLIQSSGPQWVQNHVEAWQLKEDKPRVDPGWFHPSSLGTACDAKLAFEFLGVYPREDRVPPRTRRIFDNGHNRDEAWKTYLRESGLSLIKAEPDKERLCPTCGGKDYDGRHICFPEFRIRGDFDDLITNPFTKEPVVFEFKTKNTALFTKLKKEDVPDAEHVIQTQPYLAYHQHIGVKRAIVQYENKDTQDLHAIYVPFDSEMWMRIIERCQRIVWMLASGYSPERACKYRPCDWADCTIADFPKLTAAYRAAQGLE